MRENSKFPNGFVRISCRDLPRKGGRGVGEWGDLEIAPKSAEWGQEMLKNDSQKERSCAIKKIDCSMNKKILLRAGRLVIKWLNLFAEGSNEKIPR